MVNLPYQPTLDVKSNQSSLSEATRMDNIDPESSKRTNLGRESVESLLISAASHLLSRQGPKTLSIRDIAKYAGVNHGQIHHYFGSKQNLLRAAIRNLAQDHHQHHSEFELDENFIPPPLSLSKDQDYIMAIVRCVIDGEMELATIELNDGRLGTENGYV